MGVRVGGEVGEKGSELEKVRHLFSFFRSFKIIISQKTFTCHLTDFNETWPD